MLKRLMTALTVLMFAMPLRAQEHTLNLQDAEIQVLVATVAEITGRNFIVDPRVTGKVTVISSQAMDEDQVYRVFLSILQVHGFAAVPGDDVTKIVPDITARQSGREGTGADAVVTQVMPVQSAPGGAGCRQRPAGLRPQG